MNLLNKKYFWRILFMILLTFVFSRNYYYLVNKNLFEISYSNLLKINLEGLIFDIPTLMILMLPAFFFYILSIFFYHKWIYFLSDILFKFALIFFLVSNIFDAHYYRFIYHRSNISDMLLFADSKMTISYEIKNNILLALAFLLGIILIFKIKICNYAKRNEHKKTNFIFIFILTIAYVLVLATYKKTLSPKQAVLYTESEFTPLLTNTPLNIIYSAYNKYIVGIEEIVPNRNYFDEKNFLYTNQIARQYNAKEMHKYNIVVFLLESFSSTFLDLENKNKAHTPFLDSIMKNSWLCTNSYANGFTSATSLSALSTSIPALMNNPIFSSDYQNIKYNSYIKILDSLGYNTSFFFGSNDDHFGFKKGLSAFGIQHYFGENEFGDLSLHDGVWGIYDGPFMQFFAKKTNEFPKPFFSIFFNLSSHYPFKLPPDADSSFYKNNFITAHRSIQYVDKMIQNFFDSVKNKPWYNNTIFVFVGDHVSKEQNEEQYNMRTRYRVPLFFYKADGSLKHIDTRVVDQKDIGPSLLQLIGYNKKFNSFGESIFDEKRNSRTIQKSDDYEFQYIDDDNIAVYDESKNKISKIYNYKLDKNLNSNLIGDALLTAHYDSLVKKYLQNFSIRIRENKMNN